MFGLTLNDRTLVYLEGDASIRTYENADGQRQTNFNIVQRMFLDWSFQG